MEKITIKELVNFRRRSDKKQKINFANKLKNRKIKDKNPENDKIDKSGNYWITSMSCIYNVYKYNDKKFYDLKIDELHKRYETTSERNKNTIQRNIDILNNFKDFDFKDIRPTSDLKFEKISRQIKTINVDDFPIYVNPSIVYSYDQNGKKEIGAILFVPQLNGFNKPELGMFCEMLYKFLMKNFSEDFQISQEHCIAIDIFNAQKVTYFDLTSGDIPLLIANTLLEIKEL